MKNPRPTLKYFAFLTLVCALFFSGISSHAQKIQCEISAPPDENMIAALSDAIKRNPNDVIARVNRARAYFSLFRYDEVLADVRVALAADHGNAEAYFLRGRVYETRANYAKAIAAFDQAIAIDPFKKYYFFARGFSYDNLDRYELAVDDYTAALAIDAQFMDAYYNLGASQVSLKLLPEGRSNFSATLKLVEKYLATYEKGSCLTDAYLDKGLIEYFFKDYKQGEVDLKVAKELAGVRDTDSRYYLGWFYRQLKYYQFALDELNDVIKIDPSYARAYKERAEVYDRMFQKDKAAADRSKYDQLSSQKELTMPQAPVPE